MTDEELAEIEARAKEAMPFDVWLVEIEESLRPVTWDDQGFRPHADAVPWVGRTFALFAEVKRLRELADNAHQDALALVSEVRRLAAPRGAPQGET